MKKKSEKIMEIINVHVEKYKKVSGDVVTVKEVEGTFLSQDIPRPTPVYINVSYDSIGDQVFNISEIVIAPKDFDSGGDAMYRAAIRSLKEIFGSAIKYYMNAEMNRKKILVAYLEDYPLIRNWFKEGAPKVKGEYPESIDVMDSLIEKIDKLVTFLEQNPGNIKETKRSVVFVPESRDMNESNTFRNIMDEIVKEPGVEALAIFMNEIEEGLKR